MVQCSYSNIVLNAKQVRGLCTDTYYIYLLVHIKDKLELCVQVHMCVRTTMRFELDDYISFTYIHK